MLQHRQTLHSVFHFIVHYIHCAPHNEMHSRVLHMVVQHNDGTEQFNYAMHVIAQQLSLQLECNVMGRVNCNMEWISMLSLCSAKP